MSICSQCLEDVPPTEADKIFKRSDAKRLHLLKRHPEYAAKRGAKWLIGDVPDERVRSKIAENGDCWMWVGATNPNGYGHFVRRKGLGGGQKKTYVHRYVYACLVGQIPYGAEIHHSCYNRWCCNPAHLSPATHAENTADHAGPATGRRITT